MQKQKVKKCQWELQLQFKDALQNLSDALNAGYSIENAIGEAIVDLSLLYGDNSDILNEFRYMRRQIALNRNIEELFLDLGARSGLEDILVFGEVIATAKRTGGDLVKIIQRTSKNINDKVEIQREIQVMAASKKLEAVIMGCIPMGIILYLWVCMPGYLEPMYSMVIGRIIMTAALLLYIFSVVLIKKIVDIKV